MDITHDRDALAAAIYEQLRRDLLPHVEQAVREARSPGMRQACARHERRLEAQRWREHYEHESKQLAEAYAIARRTVWAAVPKISGGDPTGWAATPTLVDTPAGLLPMMPGSWRR